MTIFSNVENEILTKRKSCGFANFLQTKLTQMINFEENSYKNNKILQKKLEIFDKKIENIIKALYCSNEVGSNAPIGSVLTTTKGRINQLNSKNSPKIRFLKILKK